jgi:hypothetical protein
MLGGMKSERNRVVVHFKDGKLLKGYTHDFTTVREIFHLTLEQENEEENIREIRTSDLKAIFFVKSLGGDKDYNEKKRFNEVNDPRLRGLKIKVEFSDGEIISGISLGYNRNRKGFFIIPIDQQSNNERIYVLADALRDVKVGSAAEK